MQPLNQNYPVFLLGGTFGGEAARSFSAPSGSIFMLPFTNIFCTGDMPDSPPPWTPCTEADKAGSIAALDETDRLFLNIDGTSYVDATTVEEVASIRDEFWIQTGIFPAEMAENNFWDALGYDAPPGTYATNYNVGFYAFAKLGSGTHTLQWGGGRADFTNMITATITIEPVPLPAGLPLLAAGLGALGLAGRWRRRVAV
jgi:hypothetical protein